MTIVITKGDNPGNFIYVDVNGWFRYTNFWRDVLDITLCDKFHQWLATDRWFSPSTPLSSTDKTASRQDITEILLKVALNNINHKIKLPSVLTFLYTWKKQVKWSIANEIFISDYGNIFRLSYLFKLKNLLYFLITLFCKPW